MIRLANGKLERGLVEDADYIDQQFLLGEDIREYMRVHFLRSNNVPDEINAQDVWVLDDGQSVKVTKVVDNPANPFVRFYAIKTTAKDK